MKPRVGRIIEGIRWFNPVDGGGQTIVWDDGVHIVDKVGYTLDGLSYYLKCGVIFTFATPSTHVLEAKITIKDDPTCPLCLQSR